MVDLKKAKGALLGPKGSTILLAVGMAGIVLIFLSQFFSSSSSSGSKSSQTVSKVSAGDYAAQLEKSLGGIIGSIQGVGRVRVMVTLDSGVQYVYEQNQKSTNNTTSGSSQLQQNTDTEQSTVLAQNGSGGEQPLIRTEMQPAVRGVVVVCDGGDDPVVKEQVLETVMTALGISASGISISPMAAGGAASSTQ